MEANAEVKTQLTPEDVAAMAEMVQASPVPMMMVAFNPTTGQIQVLNRGLVEGIGLLQLAQKFYDGVLKPNTPEPLVSRPAAGSRIRLS